MLTNQTTTLTAAEAVELGKQFLASVEAFIDGDGLAAADAMLAGEKLRGWLLATGRLTFDLPGVLARLDDFVTGPWPDQAHTEAAEAWRPVRPAFERTLATIRLEAGDGQPPATARDSGQPATDQEPCYPASHYTKYNISDERLRAAARRGRIYSEKRKSNRHYYRDSDVRREWPQQFSNRD